jgi:hypothetical protein
LLFEHLLTLLFVHLLFDHLLFDHLLFDATEQGCAKIFVYGTIQF